MKKTDFIGAFVSSILIHLVVILVFAFITIQLDKIEDKEEFHEVSFVYEKEYPKPVQKKSTSISQKQQFKAKKLETLRRGKKKTTKKKVKSKVEKKVNLPVLKEIPKKQESKEIEEKKTTVVDKKEQVAKELVTNNPPSQDTKENNDQIGGESGEQGADIRPSEKVVLFGPIVNRNILYSEIPEYPIWAKQKGIETEVRMKFWVSSEGKVYNISVVQKSGYLRLDLLAKKSLSKWKFTPLGDEIPQIKQWGEIVVRFILY